ncbi:MAG: amino acid racemase [Chromatiales bacterium]|nr:MAG: amino acid racemase [Chromatiales bacterium]
MPASLPSSSLTVGVLGGMGPDATLDFMAKVLAATPAGSDQDHVHMLIDHNPHVPDRTQAILGQAGAPGPVLANMAKQLQDAGADFIVMPCNTAHAFQSDIEAVLDVPFVSIIEETAAACSDFEAVGLLATRGCLASGIYDAALSVAGVRAVLPDDVETQTFMELTASIKGGDSGSEIGAGMLRLADALIARGAEAVIAGCTEIPLVLEQSMLDVPLISSTDILADATVAYALGDKELNPLTTRLKV